jgi:hypothetical protein
VKSERDEGKEAACSKALSILIERCRARNAEWLAHWHRRAGIRVMVIMADETEFVEGGLQILGGRADGYASIISGVFENDCKQ